MRILALDIFAYGHFYNKHLDFEDPSTTIHIIYGPNEAGKTTLKSGIEEVLFGMHARTTYAFLHAYDKLRIGATLAGAEGNTLSFERLKRNRDDLRSPGGDPLPVDALRPFLRGLTLDGFRTQFSLSREDMAAGSKAILEGKGELGASLYSAALGNANFTTIVATLDRQIEDLFTPATRKRRLNVAFDAHTKARSELRKSTIRPDAWAEKINEREQAIVLIAEVDQQSAQLAAQIGLLERLRAQATAYDCTARLRMALAERSSETVISPDACAEYERLAVVRQKSIEALEGVNERIAQLEHAEAYPGEMALRDHATTIMALTQGVGKYAAGRKDLEDHKLREHAIRNAEEAGHLLSRVWPGVNIAQARSRVVPSGVQSRGNELVLEFTRSKATIASVVETSQRLQDVVVAKQAEIDSLPELREVRALRAAITAGTAEGRIDAGITHSRTTVEHLRKRVEAKLLALGLFHGDLAALQRAPLPLPVTIATFKRSFDRLTTQKKLIEQRRVDAESRAQMATTALDEYRKTGNFSTIADLEAVRTARDGLFAKLAAQWRGDAAVVELDVTAARYVPAVQDADSLADDLRKNSDRLARIEQLVQQCGDAQREVDAHDVSLERAAEEREAFDREWTTLWGDCAIVPRSPDEMTAWLQAALEVRRLANELDEAETELAEFTARRSSLISILRDALAAAGSTSSLPGDELHPLLAVASQVVTDVDAIESRGRTLGAELERERRDLARNENARVTTETSLMTWRREWEGVLDALWLPHDLNPDDFAGTVNLIERFIETDRQARFDASRADGIERDNEDFRTAVVRFVSEAAPDLTANAQTAPDVVVGTLNERLTAAEAEYAKHQGRLEQLALERANVKMPQDKLESAQAALAAIAEPYAISPQTLSEVVSRSKDTLAKQGDFERSRADVEDGTGLTLEGCDREYAGRNRVQIDVDLSHAKERLGDLHGRRDALIVQRNEIEGWLADMDRSQAAVDAEAELVAIGAQIDRDARRWAELTLAREILSQQVQDYLERHQGPLIERSGYYFERLTGGAYTRLRAVRGEDGDPLIEAVDRTGHMTTIDGLSDGTRDQLYLALRLAALEEYFKTNEPQPLVLDDAFVQFDDERTKLAFQALAEFAKQTQVFYFTHHRGCVDAAIQAAPSSVLMVHDLANRWTAHSPQLEPVKP